MEQGQKNFWLAVVAGIIVMIVFGLITVNILSFIPLAGPFIGGLVAGLIARKDVMNGGKAGLVAGIIAAVVISIDMMLGLGYLQGSVAILVTAAGGLVMIMEIIYFAILGFIGGALGAALRP
jgi:hypothetical protein